MNKNLLKLYTSKEGFTLIELIVVVAILSILLSITLVAINPAKQFSQANNTKRQSDTVTILNAVNQYMADNNGSLPAAITTAAQTIQAPGFASLCLALVPQYIAALPVDPQVNNGIQVESVDCNASGWNTGYTIQQISSNNRITVTAPFAQNGATISVSR